MCGRYGLVPTKNFNRRFKITNQLKFEENKNCSPGSFLPVIIKNLNNTAVLMRWGLIPFWVKPSADGHKIGYKMINARADTIMEKPSFKKPFITQRCLIPATGFYEWQHLEVKKFPIISN